MNIKFLNFWKDFNPNNFFLPLFNDIFNKDEYIGSKSDIIIESVFNNKLSSKMIGRYQKYKNFDAFKIWYTGENIRPPISGYNITLSFDASCERTNNIYFPLWYLLFPEIISENLRPPVEKYNQAYKLNTFLESRNSDILSRQEAFVMFTGYAEPTRIKFANELSKNFKVDIFGHYNRNHVNDPLMVTRNYRFAICFENDVYPGYVTEKLFNAWFAGAIPIWNGLDKSGIINPEAYINLQNFESISKLIEYLSELYADPNELVKISSQPLLLMKPDFSIIKKKFIFALERHLGT